ncbi:SusC/RagA family TonB-linked outer membrane protein [Spirosoma rhododendri]|uniref:SusC/RagA family TonB-linked outer membrane protein n=1 Tax=Spirosoma rhododendri TaxID=2728024 RepID=A0A7L5DNF0_9BACT|nr:SusC/RagA family TonB-linked outer membrane protein [Spirosoma rhododendri]QJD79011.1 SusC/RagA family TonB-linked outer membrane protein [Spirosoma rhododendri]
MKKVLFGSWLLSLLFCLPLMAQDAVVTGRVTSSDDGTTLPGVSVVVKGTSRGTTTDANGAYRISAGSGATLTFSFVGFKSQDVVVGNRTSLNVVLQNDASTLNEVVVTAFGIQRNEREIGGSVAKVNNQQITQAAPINVATGLTGKVSGLQINTTNNGVGNNVRVQLRGARSFLGNNQALLVVDGVITDISFLSAINPNDVETTTVLKGPSAAALYGSDASNGALVITTKRGSTSNTPQISYSNSTQFESVSYMPKLQTRFGSNGGEGAPYIDRNGLRLYVPFENQSFGPAYDGSQVALGGPVLVPRQGGGYDTLTAQVPYSAQANDQRRAFFNTGVLSQHDVNFRIGDAKNFFGLNLQRVDQRGVVPNDRYNRTVIGVKGGRSTDKFTVNAGGTFTYANSNIAGGDFSQGRPVYWNVLNTPAHVPLTSYKDITSPYADVNGFYNAYYPNPYWQVTGNNSRQITNTYTIQGFAEASYKFLPWLSALYRVGGQARISSYKANRAAVGFSDFALTDPASAGNIASSLKAVNARVEDINQLTTRFTGDLLVTLNPKFGDFTTTLILGHHQQQDYTRYQRDYGASLQIPDLYNISNVIGQPEANEYYLRSRLVGAFADFTIGYKNWAFIHATGRNDWTTLLAPANRSFFYPGVDASLILTDAIPSLKNVTWLSYAKLRGGISKVGNINVSPYSLQNTFIPGTNAYTGGTAFPYGSQSGYQISNQQNDPNLKPEFTTNREVGVEVGVLNRFNLEVAYFKSNTINQTVPIQISRATGYTAALINTGEMENNGVEVDLRIRPIIRSGNFLWEASANYTYLENRVLSLYGSGANALDRLNIPFANGTTSDAYAAIGRSFPALYVTDIQRVSGDPSSPYYDPTGQYVGRPIVNGAGETVLDPTLVYAGSTQPKHRLGISNTFRYADFGLTFLWDYRGGNVIYNALGNPIEFTGVGERSADNGRQNFVFPNSVVRNADGSFAPNTNLTTRDGNLTFWTNSAYHNAGTSYVTSAAFWKLREVALTYDVPVAFLQKTKIIKSLNVALTGRNLLMFRPKSNYYTDPEFSNDQSNAVGTTNEYQTPPTRFYGFRVNVGF